MSFQKFIKQKTSKYNLLTHFINCSKKVDLLPKKECYYHQASHKFIKLQQSDLNNEENSANRSNNHSISAKCSFNSPHRANVSQQPEKGLHIPKLVNEMSPYFNTSISKIIFKPLAETQKSQVLSFSTSASENFKDQGIYNKNDLINDNSFHDEIEIIHPQTPHTFNIKQSFLSSFKFPLTIDKLNRAESINLIKFPLQLKNYSNENHKANQNMINNYESAKCIGNNINIDLPLSINMNIQPLNKNINTSDFHKSSGKSSSSSANIRDHINLRLKSLQDENAELDMKSSLFQTKMNDLNNQLKQIKKKKCEKLLLLKRESELHYFLLESLRLQVIFC